MPTLTVVCAWCKKEMGEKECDSITDDRITHSICESCSEEVLKEIEDYE